ncbi:GNAT family N-acetyltransferase [Joostella atrarenae]|uniref:GNAT family N-acetyltransferase n=1 Tax=Joostella atrarenae TaxID=679257 RepID=A0ABS9J5R8_9FLAO|nr:GNAT family protein [Joostella atrarenae]MCF8715773.1 GNAT family N-acetyltransferase [Joostella atrarenae]
MITLSGNTIYLRALEAEDLDFLYALENDEKIWEVSETLTPYSKYILKEYLANSHRDIFEVKQLRLVISDYNNNILGLIDLFDFNPKNKRAGVGIVVLEEGNRNRGVGREALSLLIDYAFKHLDLHQLYANISENNKPSIHLFSNLGFERVGVKKDWNYTSGEFHDEILYQKINK